MLDVVPPGPGTPSKRDRHSKRRPPRAQAVEVDWRLPARLRRPVHIELERQRKRQRQRAAIVGFERRPLYPTSRGAGPKIVQNNRGAEHHTGDVYRESRPLLAATVPPYAGSFLRGRPAPRPVVQRPPAPQKPKAVPRMLAGERDVPYQWSAAAKSAAPAVTVTPPRQKRFALPLHLSIWPFKTGAKEAAPTSKKKVQNTDSLMS